MRGGGGPVSGGAILESSGPRVHHAEREWGWRHVPSGPSTRFTETGVSRRVACLTRVGCQFVALEGVRESRSYSQQGVKRPGARQAN